MASAIPSGGPCQEERERERNGNMLMSSPRKRKRRLDRGFEAVRTAAPKVAKNSPDWRAVTGGKRIHAMRAARDVARRSP